MYCFWEEESQILSCFETLNPCEKMLACAVFSRPFSLRRATHWETLGLSRRARTLCRTRAIQPIPESFTAIKQTWIDITVPRDTAQGRPSHKVQSLHLFCKTQAWLVEIVLRHVGEYLHIFRSSRAQKPHLNFWGFFVLRMWRPGSSLASGAAAGCRLLNIPVNILKSVSSASTAAVDEKISGSQMLSDKKAEEGIKCMRFMGFVPHGNTVWHSKSHVLSTVFALFLTLSAAFFTLGLCSIFLVALFLVWARSPLEESGSRLPGSLCGLSVSQQAHMGERLLSELAAPQTPPGGLIDCQTSARGKRPTRWG